MSTLTPLTPLKSSTRNANRSARGPLQASGLQGERVRKERERTKRPTALDRLIQAGTRLLSEVGLEAINTNSVARAASVGVGTFYNHFPDKHALHRAVVSGVFAGLRQSMLAATAAAGPETEAQARALTSAVMDFAEASPDAFRVAFGRTLPAAGSGAPALAFSTRPVEARLRQLQALGRLDPGLDPEAAARAQLAMQSGVVLWWLEDPAARNRDQVIETLVRLHPAVAAGRT
jgi:AcrR family transcriptional regulator